MPKSSAIKAIDTVSPGIGGSYAKNPVTGELSLTEPPTAEAIKTEPSLPVAQPEVVSGDDINELDPENPS